MGETRLRVCSEGWQRLRQFSQRPPPSSSFVLHCTVRETRHHMPANKANDKCSKQIHRQWEKRGGVPESKTLKNTWSSNISNAPCTARARGERKNQPRRDTECSRVVGEDGVGDVANHSPQVAKPREIQKGPEGGNAVHPHLRVKHLSLFDGWQVLNLMSHWQVIKSKSTTKNETDLDSYFHAFVFLDQWWS